MKVDLKDGRCRTCGDQLEIVDADDATMTVECANGVCADSYQVEPDAFGDGAVVYYPEFMAARRVGEESDD